MSKQPSTFYSDSYVFFCSGVIPSIKNCSYFWTSSHPFTISSACDANCFEKCRYASTVMRSVHPHGQRLLCSTMMYKTQITLCSQPLEWFSYLGENVYYVVDSVICWSTLYVLPTFWWLL